MCIDIQLNEKKKMGDKIVDEEVEIVEAHIKKGKDFEVSGDGRLGRAAVATAATAMTVAAQAESLCFGAMDSAAACTSVPFFPRLPRLSSVSRCPLYLWRAHTSPSLRLIVLFSPMRVFIPSTRRVS